MSLPSFVAAVLLIRWLALGWHVVPVSGWGEPRHYVLPVLVLLVQPLAYITRVTRAGVLRVLPEDYVRTAHSKGLSPWRVLSRHVLPNAAISVITIAGLAFSYALTGAFVVETIFRIPGLGQAAIGALFLRDYPMVQAVGAPLRGDLHRDQLPGGPRLRASSIPGSATDDGPEAAPLGPIPRSSPVDCGRARRARAAACAHSAATGRRCRPG